MYEIIINISKYLFLIYISLFLINGFIVSLIEKDIIKLETKIFLSFQRTLTLLFHITGFTLLSFNPQTRNFETNVIPIFLTSTLFILIGNLIGSIIYKKGCSSLWNAIFFLLSISLVMLYRLNPNLAVKQLTWCIIGFTISIFIPIIFNKLPRLDNFKNLYLILGLSLLLATLLFGVKTGGAKNWISLKVIVFQPSEIVKILFIFYLASYFSKENIKTKELLIPSIVSFIIVICLIFQKDLGSALIFFMTYIVLIYISTSKKWIILLGFISTILGSLVAYNIFHHVKIRFDIWLNPWEDITGNGWQIAQSLFSIGTFGMFGSGLNLGLPKAMPVVENDLIFAAICEEFGVLFGIGLILVLTIIFLRGCKISLKTKSRFLSLVSSGLTSLICFQSFLIIGGVIKFIPLTGVTLPFISYGGSSMIINFIILGIFQWISIKNNKYDDEINLNGDKNVL